MTITALIAINFRFSASLFHASNNLVVSAMNFFPAFPEGTLKMFLCQKTVSSYIALMIWSKSALEWLPQTGVGPARFAVDEIGTSASTDVIEMFCKLMSFSCNVLVSPLL